jgi:hypothetical protein
MAALAQAPVGADPTYFVPASMSVYSGVLAQSWPEFLPVVRKQVDQILTAQLVGASVAGVSVQGLRNLDIAIDPPPALFASAPAAQQSVTMQLPAAPSTWRIGATIDVGATITVQVLGQWVSTPITLAVDVEVSDISVTQTVDLDMSQPGQLTVRGVATPTVNLRLDLTSPSPVLSTVAPALTTILDPVIRVALVAAAGVIQREIGVQFQGLPATFSWGVGGPALTAIANPPALEPLSDEYLERTRRDLVPFGMVYSADYDDPRPGHGTIIGYDDMGDSPIWTGFYACAELYRHELIGDPVGLASVSRVLDSLDVLLHVSGQPGLLCRAAVPLSSPYVSTLARANDKFVGVYQGIGYQAISNISRDQYIGTFLAIGQAMKRAPSLRAKAGALAAVSVDYLEGAGWVPRRVSDPSVITAPFLQSPASLVAFPKMAAMHDPGRYGALAQRMEPLADMMWFGNWLSSREVHESYYKFNLTHANHLSLFELETNPTLYRTYLRSHSTIRPVIGHHQNAWFDLIHAIAIPTQRAQWAPAIQISLERAALRPRRGFAVQNSQDPNVQIATYTATQPTGGGSPGSSLQTQPRTRNLAVYPIVPENRPPSNFFWQRSPFELDAGAPPTREYSGTEISLPYWAARSHGILR